MKLVIGRGKNRRVYEVPCANIISRADRKEVEALVDNVCEMVGITPVRRP